ncbi:MAG: SPFH domain-containing protein [Patescibacteria group bacterium]
MAEVNYRSTENLGWYRSVVVLLYITFVAVGIALWCFPIEIVKGKPFGLDVTFGFLVVCYTLASLRQVGEDEHAAKTFFGRPMQNVDSGLTFVPLFICRLVRFSTNLQTLVIGSPREHPTERDSDGKIKTFDFVPSRGTLVSEEPLRITTASYTAAEWKVDGNPLSEDDVKKRFPREDALAGRSTIDPQIIVTFIVLDACKFVKAVGSKIELAVAPIAQAARGTLQAFCGKRDLSFIIHQLEDEAQKQLLRDLEILVGDPDSLDPNSKKEPLHWGVDIRGVRISDIGLSYKVNNALSEARAAGARKETTITDAEANKKKFELEGEGAAKAAFLLLQAQARGSAKMAKIMKTDEGKLAAQLQAMKEALSKGDNKLFMVGGKFHDLMEILASALGK